MFNVIQISYLNHYMILKMILILKWIKHKFHAESRIYVLTNAKYFEINLNCIYDHLFFLFLYRNFYYVAVLILSYF